MTVAIAAAPSHATMLNALLASFNDARRAPNDVAEPAVILWPDPERQWQPAVSRLREAFPFVYTLGPYSPDTRAGPAIWLRCIVDRSLPELSPPRDTVPVLYLPGVARQVLRAGEECPADLQPLVELQFRGRIWHQTNGQDWTLEAFLGSRQGLGLEIARDARTREAMLRTLPVIADTDLAQLRDRRLEAEDFDGLAVDDPVRDMLRWLNDPNGTRKSLDDVRWHALSSWAQRTFAFDLTTDPPVDAADRLVRADRSWEPVWRRYVESARLYPRIPTVLRQAEAGNTELALDLSRRPGANEEAETALRVALQPVGDLPHHEACMRVLELEREHGRRRELVWAQLGESPLAIVLESLARLAALANSPLAGTTMESIADSYALDGWRCDAAALSALARPSRQADAGIVAEAVRALYLPWLQASARNFQQLASRHAQSMPLRDAVKTVTQDRDTCLLFADGLRFDVAHALKSLLETRELAVHLTHGFAAIPTATPTAKPAASPVADALTGNGSNTDFTPVFRESEQTCNAQRLRDEMARRGITVLAADEVRFPTDTGGGWTEAGQLDALGHMLGVALAGQVAKQVEQLAERIIQLLDSGWARVRVITDHGWLLMPGGLPKVELPRSVAPTKWARCALVGGESITDMPVWSWHWEPQIRIATPPGVSSFGFGNEYAHGGVSPQESIVPDLLVHRGEQARQPVITDVAWTRLRCKVTVHDAEPSNAVDIRANWKDPDASLVKSRKTLDGTGQASLVVVDDEYEGAAAVVVVLDGEGNVVTRKATTVGDS